MEALAPLIEALEETRNKCNIASLSGGCAGLVGGLLTGAGLISLPFTGTTHHTHWWEGCSMVPGSSLSPSTLVL